MREKIKVLNVDFGKVTLEEALEDAIKAAKSEFQHYFTTPNPEIVLEARQNPAFLNILNGAHLNIADGIGILWAAKFLNKITGKKSPLTKFVFWSATLAAILLRPKYIKTELKERVTGVDLMYQVAERSAKHNLSIFLLGAKEGIADELKNILSKKIPGIQIVGTHAGSPAPEQEEEIISKINKHGPQILFVAYGAPKQELWIAKNLKKMPSVKLAIGVGGAFDFIAGKKKRAGKMIQKLGLEWLYRLIQEPSRLKRIFNAVIKFPIVVLREALKK